MKERDEHTECCFDTFCKRLLRYEMIDTIREYDRQGRREATFSDLSKAERAQLQYIDEYYPDRRVFTVRGLDIEIADSDLVRALAALPSDRRDMILLAYLLDLSDADIAAQMGLKRSTVQYRRTSTLEQLRNLMMEEN